MKIVADFNNKYIASLSKELALLGHNIIGYTGQNKVYDIVRSSVPDICFCLNATSALTDCAINEKIPSILYGYGDKESLVDCLGVCVDKESDSIKNPLILNLFGDAKEYGGYYQYNLESDILFSSNYGSQLVPVYSELFIKTNLNIKYAGKKFINCNSFVGITNNEEFGSLAKSAKVVITSNLYEHVSLLLIGVCSLMPSELGVLETLLKDERSRRKYIEEKQKEFSENRADLVVKKIHDRIKEYEKTRNYNTEAR